MCVADRLCKAQLSLAPVAMHALGIGARARARSGIIVRACLTRAFAVAGAGRCTSLDFACIAHTPRQTFARVVAAAEISARAAGAGAIAGRCGLHAHILARRTDRVRGTFAVALNGRRNALVFVRCARAQALAEMVFGRAAALADELIVCALAKVGASARVELGAEADYRSSCAA